MMVPLSRLSTSPCITLLGDARGPSPTITHNNSHLAYGTEREYPHGCGLPPKGIHHRCLFSRRLIRIFGLLYTTYFVSLSVRQEFIGMLLLLIYSAGLVFTNSFGSKL
ncbi:hypothetical protein BDV95DRAFT_235251 [Massariosphaeria phaeospora]|uniref:Uncharacterized protein n=1 Tax=Massariosphaeria phaeospora TaxID=100035 RepID=A0A7C8MWM8_9PLEO|nr:hypothetical protein BDV95DRAFT_235251 [Massariosphaeria phaeospora]